MRRDVFISYSWKDKDFALRLAMDLRAAGLKVWIDKWEMQIGDSLNKKVAEGISNSAWLCVVLSPDSVASPWVEKELNAALARELERRDVFVLPALHKACNIPLFLRDKIYADFRTSYDQGLAALLQRLQAAVEPQLVSELLSGDEDRIRRGVARISPESRTAYVTALREHLTSGSSTQQNASLTALFLLRDRDLASHLLRAAADTQASVRRHAVFLIGRARLRQALNVVSERLGDSSPDVRATARDVYRQLTGGRP
jgi:hypothetical protein